jgi:hypothetical protein
MAQRFSDTHSKAEEVQLAGLRSLPSWRKMQIVSDLTLTVRAFALAGLRGRFAGATLGELRRRLASLCLGPELATKVYGPEPGPPTIG